MGTPDGDAEQLFAWIVDGAIGSDGRVAIADAKAREVRVYDGRSGKQTLRMGGPGDGPGEVSRTPTGGLRVAFGARDSLILWDNLRKRMMWFDSAGRYARQLDYAAIRPLIPTSDFWEVASDGSLLLSDAQFDRDGLSITETWTLVRGTLRVPIGSGSLFQSRRLPDGGSMASPFSRLAIPALGGNPVQIYVPDAERWEVRVYDELGALAGIWRIALPRVPVTAAMVQRGRVRIDSLRLHSENRRAAIAAYDALPVPDSLPAIGQIWTDHDEFVWVSHYAPQYDGEMQGPSLYEVFDSRGVWLGRVGPVPAHVLAIGREHLLSHTLDPAGIPLAHLTGLSRGP